MRTSVVLLAFFIFAQAFARGFLLSLHPDKIVLFCVLLGISALLSTAVQRAVYSKYTLNTISAGATIVSILSVLMPGVCMNNYPDYVVPVTGVALVINGLFASTIQASSRYVQRFGIPQSMAVAQFTAPVLMGMSAAFFLQSNNQLVWSWRCAFGLNIGLLAILYFNPRLRQALDVEVPIPDHKTIN